MNFQPATPVTVAAFLAIIAFVIAAFLLTAYRGAGPDPARSRAAVVRTALVIAGLLAFFSALPLSGRMPSLPLGGFPFFFGPFLLMSIGFGLSPFGRSVAERVPLAWLVGFQAFRLPLELVLHSWAAQGTIPPTMTWTGQNWDIVSGIVALLACPFASRHRSLAWFANLVGAALLLNVIRVAVFSSLLPFAWDLHPPLLLFRYFPYALIVPVCVGGALIGHIWLTRALLRARPSIAPTATTSS